MNFEVVDNVFQTVTLLLSAAAAFVLSVMKRSRVLMMLSFGYGSFMMGTLFYVLHIVILGYNPKIFYVSEVSWLAAYLFFFSIALLISEKTKLYLPGAAVALLVYAVSFTVKIFGPSHITSTAFAFLVGGITYLSLCGIKKCGAKNSAAEIMMLVCVLLQIALYIVSEFMTDYTRFNLYFAVDIALTLSMASLLPIFCRRESVK
ncbi:MAG: hypothetical protein PUJ47_09385 [Clostridia bacterium]|nr:hypothetical protein [Clostridia bacterium]